MHNSCFETYQFHMWPICISIMVARIIWTDIKFITKRDHCVRLALCNGNYYYNVVLTHNKSYIIGIIHSFTPYYVEFDSQRLLSLLLLYFKKEDSTLEFVTEG